MADPSPGKKRKRARAGWLFTALGGFLVVLFWRLFPRRHRPSTQPIKASADASEDTGKVAYERADWPLGPVALIYVAIPILLVISSLALIIAYPNALPDVRRTLRIAPSGPRLQTDPEGDLRRFRADEEKRLNTYYWIDKQKGIVQIPIRQAMQNLVKTGVPGFPKEQQ